jgi:GrpB-like predicted nucleotidyltransferase (UPF0157 family)
MLTDEQEKWVNNLSGVDVIKIIPFDPTCQEKFEKVREIIRSRFGEAVRVVHRGATSFGISGQDEIDVYVPVLPGDFDGFIDKLSELFGQPKKVYPLNRAHFITHDSGKHIDVYLINEEAPSWLEGLKFEDYLRSHPEALEEYRILKEKGAGLSVREYYRRKIEFINDILNKIYT